jgi:hypothetical protein
MLEAEALPPAEIVTFLLDGIRRRPTAAEAAEAAVLAAAADAVDAPARPLA